MEIAVKINGQLQWQKPVICADMEDLSIREALIQVREIPTDGENQEQDAGFILSPRNKLSSGQELKQFS